MRLQPLGFVHSSSVDALRTFFDFVKTRNRFIDVRHFGAIIDGKTADNKAIQQAIDYAHFIGIPKVYLPAGHYHFDNEIQMKSNVFLQGEGEFETIFQGLTGGTEKHYISLHQSLENIGFAHFQIHATDSGDNQFAQIYQNSAKSITNVVFHHIRIFVEKTAKSAISFFHDEGTNENIVFHQCTFILPERNEQERQNYGIHIQKTTDHVWVTECYFELTDTSYNALSIYANCNDFHIMGNTLDTSGHSPIAISPGHHGEIIGNIVRNCPNPQEAGIKVEWRSYESHGGNEPSHDILVSGNMVEHCLRGIMVYKDANQTNAVSYHVLIQGNITHHCDRGINIDHGRFITITQNQSYNDVTGILVQGDADEMITITNNTITWNSDNDSGDGIRCEINNAFLSGNIFYDRSNQNGTATINLFGNQNVVFGNWIVNSTRGIDENNTEEHSIWESDRIRFSGSNQTDFSTFEEFDESIDFSGPFDSASYPVHFQRDGQWVTLHLPQVEESGNETTDFITSTPIPTRFRPSSRIYHSLLVQDDGSLADGTLVITADGELEIYVQFENDFASTTGNVGFQSIQGIHYSIE